MGNEPTIPQAEAWAIISATNTVVAVDLEEEAAWCRATERYDFASYNDGELFLKDNGYKVIRVSVTPHDQDL